MRVLVVLTPLMYREAIAHSLRQHRSALEVRIAAPEAAEEELRSFAPHLLVEPIFGRSYLQPGIAETLDNLVEPRAYRELMVRRRVN